MRRTYGSRRVAAAASVATIVFAGLFVGGAAASAADYGCATSISATKGYGTANCWLLPVGKTQFRAAVGCQRIGGSQFYVSYSLWRWANQNADAVCSLGYNAIQVNVQFR
jgi:hypothetical protein